MSKACGKEFTRMLGTFERDLKCQINVISLNNVYE